MWIEILYLNFGSAESESLPTRECGLKYLWPLLCLQALQSLPTRECGLKSLSQLPKWIFYLSLPTRECGLKSLTRLLSCQRGHRHSLRGSVDWNKDKGWKILTFWVTPYAGVWIEISLSRLFSINSMSLPTRECGLKFSVAEAHHHPRRHSLRGSVDWNQSLMLICLYQWELVTPYAGVWIEIVITSIFFSAHSCHSLRGSVDWNLLIVNNLHQLLRHSLRGSVDWNYFDTPAKYQGIVTPYAGVWIEI